ncbi:hypothetical protein [Streptomyces sp. RFCAC02]|uniref:hypothetical protein n=1 Tax=Streptomyces sp. RFCAC02 TaxID=2499143 RepID=UPI00101EA314|nr:hypothetical protein [Streptomyces sp. RFCAC02]
MTILNIGGLNDAGDGVDKREKLAAMKEKFFEIASTREMFGDVPNADLASAALERAAAAMLRELEATGQTLGEIRLDVVNAAGIGENGDEEAHAVLNRTQVRDVKQLDNLLTEAEYDAAGDTPPGPQYAPGGQWYGAGG